MILKRNIALCFVILFTMIISAPTIIVSYDDSADISALFGMNEEEEQEDLKILFENCLDFTEHFLKNQLSNEFIGYTSKNYFKPHLSLVLPPPKTHFC